MANPNPRTWDDLDRAHLNGTMKQYPARFAADIARLGWKPNTKPVTVVQAEKTTQPAAPLGRVPSHLSKDERKVWLELSKVRPWLTSSSREDLEQATVLTLKDRTARREAQTKTTTKGPKTRFTVREREMLDRIKVRLDAGRTPSTPTVPKIAPTPVLTTAPTVLTPKQQAEITSREGWMQFVVEDAETLDAWLAETRAIDPHWTPTSDKALNSLRGIEHFLCSEDARIRELDGKQPQRDYSYDAELHDRIKALRRPMAPRPANWETHDSPTHCACHHPEAQFCFKM